MSPPGQKWWPCLSPSIFKGECNLMQWFLVEINTKGKKRHNLVRHLVWVLGKGMRKVMNGVQVLKPEIIWIPYQISLWPCANYLNSLSHSVPSITCGWKCQFQLFHGVVRSKMHACGRCRKMLFYYTFFVHSVNHIVSILHRWILIHK